MHCGLVSVGYRMRDEIQSTVTCTQCIWYDSPCAVCVCVCVFLDSDAPSPHRTPVWPAERGTAPHTASQHTRTPGETTPHAVSTSLRKEQCDWYTSWTLCQLVRRLLHGDAVCTHAKLCLHGSPLCTAICSVSGKRRWLPPSSLFVCRCLKWTAWHTRDTAHTHTHVLFQPFIIKLILQLCICISL